MDKFNDGVNISGHDDIYQMIVDLHADGSEEKSQKINAKLIIAMINQIGSEKIVKEIIEMVRLNEEKYNPRSSAY
jgi:Zn-dependent M16 (insulinase) family peptidase